MVNDLKTTEKTPPGVINMDKQYVTGWIAYLYDEIMTMNENIATLHAAIKELEATVVALDSKIDSVNSKIPPLAVKPEPPRRNRSL